MLKVGTMQRQAIEATFAFASPHGGEAAALRIAPAAVKREFFLISPGNMFTENALIRLDDAATTQKATVCYRIVRLHFVPDIENFYMLVERRHVLAARATDAYRSSTRKGSTVSESAIDKGYYFLFVGQPRGSILSLKTLRRWQIWEDGDDDTLLHG